MCLRVIFLQIIEEDIDMLSIVASHKMMIDGLKRQSNLRKYFLYM